MSTQELQKKPTLFNELSSDLMVNQIARVIPAGRGDDAADAAARGYLLTAYTTIQSNPVLAKCSPQSIKKELVTLASMGLPVDKRGYAYLVPYQNKGVMEVQAQIGYLGLLDLCFRSGKIKAVSANCIYESELPNVKITRVNGQIKVEHPFTYEKPSGKLVAVYATAEVEGIGSQTIVLRADEIEKFRKFSKAPNSPAWKDNYEAMAKKTAYRQLAKFLPKSIVDETRRTPGGQAVPVYEPKRFSEKKADAAVQVAQSLGSTEIDANFEEEEDVTFEPDASQTEESSNIEDLEFMKETA